MYARQRNTYLHSVKLSFSFAVICNLLSISCINNIPEQIPEAGNIPISLTTSLKNTSRVTTDEFEKGEAIGLYITVQPSTIDMTRYIDNMKFSYDPLTGFVPDETIFYPEGNVKSDFTGYYPYNQSAIGKGESTIKVEVRTDQSSNAARSASDFMTATSKSITASTDPVALEFRHKLFRLNIHLNPVSGYTNEMLLASNPTVKIKNVYTRAIYDLTTDKFTDLSLKADIIPHGIWRIENDRLCGKSAILIPQTLAQSHIILELYVEGRLFECEMESEYILGSGIAENSTITLQSSSDATQNTINTSISEWTSKDTQWTANETETVLRTSELDFARSNVLKVMNKEKQIAEIRLEYLHTTGMDKQAVVIYPMANGKADLANGLAIEVKEETENKHGGNVSWNTPTNSLTYTEGRFAIIPYIYITGDGEIKTARPENALQIQLKPDILTDHRGEETIEYPVVKIGTQYWTRSNYKTSKYVDGANIIYGGAGEKTGGVTVDNNTPQYYDYAKAYIFYNTASIATNNLVPYGWRVGNETDFNRLKTYIQDNAAVLKNNQNAWNNNNYPITNLTGFNGVGTGYFNKTYTDLAISAAYWCANNEQPNILDKIVILSVNNNKVTIGNATTSDMALSIRYVRN